MSSWIVTDSRNSWNRILAVSINAASLTSATIFTAFDPVSHGSSLLLSLIPTLPDIWLNSFHDLVGCSYVLHSSGQLYSHKRKHERRENELAYRKFRLAQTMMKSFPGDQNPFANFEVRDDPFFLKIPSRQNESMFKFCLMRSSCLRLLRWAEDPMTRRTVVGTAAIPVQKNKWQLNCPSPWSVRYH